MYILFDEYGQPFRTDEVTEDMKMAVDYGQLTIVRVDNDIPMVYDSGEWHPVPTT